MCQICPSDSQLCWAVGTDRSSSFFMYGCVFSVQFLQKQKNSSASSFAGENHWTSYKRCLPAGDTAAGRPCCSIPPAALCEKHKPQPKPFTFQLIYVPCMNVKASHVGMVFCSETAWFGAGLQVHERGAAVPEPAPRCSALQARSTGFF